MVGAPHWRASVLMGGFSKKIVGSRGGGRGITTLTMGNPDDSTNFKI